MAHHHESAGNSVAPGSASTAGPSSLDQARDACSDEAFPLARRQSLAIHAALQIGALAKVVKGFPNEAGDTLIQESCAIRISQLVDAIVTALDPGFDPAQLPYDVHHHFTPWGRRQEREGSHV